MQRSRQADRRANRLVLVAILLAPLGGCRERPAAPLRVASAGATQPAAATDPRSTVDPSRRTAAGAIQTTIQRVTAGVVAVGAAFRGRSGAAARVRSAAA